MTIGLHVICFEDACMVQKPEAAGPVGEDGTSKQPHTALVIGLGGGCLPMYMRHIVGLSVQVVELDPVVADLASRHFGFVADEQLQVGSCFISLLCSHDAGNGASSCAMHDWLITHMLLSCILLTILQQPLFMLMLGNAALYACTQSMQLPGAERSSRLETVGLYLAAQP